MVNKKLTEKETLEKIFKRVKPSIIGIEKYNIFRIYRSRYEKGELSEKGKKKLFEFFGYSSECVYTYHPEKDHSKEEN